MSPIINRKASSVNRRVLTAEALGEERYSKLQAAFERCKVNAIQRDPDDVQPERLPRSRATARALSLLQQDTPELRALLKKVGLGFDDLTPSHFQILSSQVLGEVDRLEAEHNFDNPWDKAPQGYGDEAPLTPGLHTVKFSSVVPTEIDWIWPGVLAKGMLTLLTAEPGIGKTSAMIDTIARRSVGRRLPGTKGPISGRRDALYVSAEDPLNTVLVPKLLQYGGDTTRVEGLKFAVGDDRKEKHLALDHDLQHLDNWLAQHPNVELVVFDPISAYLGRADTHKDASVRAVLGPLAKLAEKRQVALVAIAHFNKSTEGSAINRSMGSIAFVGQARLAWTIMRDSEDPSLRLFLPSKVNLCDPTGLAFRFKDDGRIEWDETPRATNANDFLANTRTMPSKQEQAKAFLVEALKNGPLEAAKLEELAAAENIGDRTLDIARKKLGVESKKVGGKNGKWVCSLPSPTKP